MSRGPRPPYAQDVASYPSEEYQRAFMAWIVWHIWTWKDGYYNKDGSPVDDATYDLWWANLLSMESRYPHLIVDGSPTGAVGAAPEIQTEPVTKPSPVHRLTLADLKVIEEQRNSV